MSERLHDRIAQSWVEYDRHYVDGASHAAINVSLDVMVLRIALAGQGIQTFDKGETVEHVEVTGFRRSGFPLPAEATGVR